MPAWIRVELDSVIILSLDISNPWLRNGEIDKIIIIMIISCKIENILIIHWCIW
jgi:hypothetical protein